MENIPSRSKMFRETMKAKRNQPQNNNTSKSTKRVGDRPFTNIKKTEKGKGER